MVRVWLALLAFALSLALAWVAMWGLALAGWMPNHTPAEFATVWAVALMSIAVGASALACLVLAVWLLVEPVTRLCDKITARLS
jgi:hypothetical protein